ncbi:hypothetical protein PPYR_07337 [Photinus pyralis]|uniref:Uncharacterized protein n=1 Tax=Photinus pyralis TaxID=7054 RepID=A0A5N4AQ52_PHOPY|nr:hypothetical protein PPYR_07337 [Photinus pyralis]
MKIWKVNIMPVNNLKTSIIQQYHVRKVYYKAIMQKMRQAQVLTKIIIKTAISESSDWLQFRDSFESLINNNSRITNVQRFHYLKRALQGEAFESIANIQVTNDNFSIAWELLRSLKH